MTELCKNPADEGNRLERLAERLGVWSWFFYWAACAMILFGIYGRAIGYPFLLDDSYFFVRNATMRDWSGLWRVWTLNYWEHAEAGLFRPLLKSLWTLQIAGGGGSKAIILIVSIAFHALNATLAASIVRRLGANVLPSMAAGLWFALHTAHAEVILFGVGQGEIFGLSVILFGLWFYLSRGTDPAPDRRRPFAFAAAILIALLIKEQAYAWIAIGSAILILWNRESPGTRIASMLLLIVGAGMITAIRIGVLGGFGPEGEYLAGRSLSIMERAVLIVYLFGRYAILSAIPGTPSPDYTWLALEIPFPIAHPYALIGAALLTIILLCILYFLARGHRVPLIFIIIYVGSLLPFLGLRPIGTLFAERHAYHSLAGLAMFIGWGAHRLPQPRVTRAIAGVLCIFALLNGWRASLAVPRWSSGISLWEGVLSDRPASFLAASSLAHYSVRNQEYADAEYFARRALELKPDLPNALIVLADLEMMKGNIAEARSLFHRALESHPSTRLDAEVGLAMADAIEGNMKAARARHDRLREQYGEDRLLDHLAERLNALEGPPAR